jgi:uncharacterized membrane-anchored protein YhcB (DUF1043 family)
MERKTKQELMDEMKHKEEELEAARKKLARYETYKQFDEGAEMVKALYDSYISAGFTAEQAFSLVETSIKTAFQNQNATPRRFA